ncbi:uncharacterized protein UDID_18863 [Ustilago sp. UG-2017a]|nr:uncharacterized protein UDID_18863 [Ustilago sp. UG-2017a]
MVIYLFTASPATLLLLSLQRVPSSSSTVQGGLSSTTPVLLSCVDSFDTAPPPQDLLAGCHGPECSGSRRAPVESMAVVQSPWRPWTPTDSHAKEDRAHMRGGPAKKRTKLKEHADGYHSGAREIRAKGTITGRRRRSSV